MIQRAHAAALEWRIRRLGGEWAWASVRYVSSPQALDGLVVTWAGRGMYLHRAGQWRWIGKSKAAAALRIGQIERGETPRPPPPSPAEVLGVVLQVAGAIFGFVRDVRR